MSTLEQALSKRRLEPTLSLRSLENEKVAKSTLHDRETGKHAPRGVRGSRLLSVVEEAAFVDKINRYAAQGTLLEPRHIVDLAAQLKGEKPSKNWGSNFIKRHKDVITSRYFAIQDMARIAADTPENRRKFWSLAVTVLGDKKYLPRNIFNMDEVGFKLSDDSSARALAPRASSSKSQSALPSNVHITVVACIGVEDAPIPPLLLYAGQSLQQEWLQVRDETPDLTAWVSDSGYSNGFLTNWWLRNVFEPATKARAGADRRLLILDGTDIHHSPAFYDSCDEFGIDLLYIPHNLSARYQPLDVNFNNTLKKYYRQQVRDYQLDLNPTQAAKGYFYRWFQRAWAKTINTHQITSAWRRSGLHPLDKAAMGAETPPPMLEPPQDVLTTPQSARMARALDRAVRQGKIQPQDAFQKALKAYEVAEAENAVLRDEAARRKAADEVDKAARRHNKRTKFPHGAYFDQRWREEHAAELVEWRNTEAQENARKAREAANKKAATAAARKGKKKAPQATQPEEG